jgi:hypothetical protein
MSVKIDDNPFRKEDVSNNKSSPKNTVSNDIDNPDKFIQKMKRTISKKKNNYKNIPELDNIYDKNDTPHENMSNFKPISYDNQKTPVTATSTMLDMGELLDESAETENYTKNGDGGGGKRGSGGVYNPYKREYEFDPPEDSGGYGINKKILDGIRKGTIKMEDIDKLLHTGEIDQAQYDWLFGRFLNFKGFNWQNTPPPKVEEKKCGPEKKNCGPDAKNIIEYIKYYYYQFKYYINQYSYVLKYLATVLYKAVDGAFDNKPSNSEADVDIIAKVLHFLIMVPISCYYSYNWFYITFYHKMPNNAKSGVYRKNILDALHSAPYIIPTLQPAILLHTWFIQEFLVDTWDYVVGIFGFFGLRSLSNFFRHPMTILLCITVVIMFVNCLKSGYFLNLFFSFIENTEMHVKFDKYLYLIVIWDVLFGISPVNFIIRIINAFKTYLSPIGSLIKFIIILILSLFLIRLAGIIPIVHSYVMSLAAILIFHSDHNPFECIKDIKKSIYSYANPCRDDTIDKSVARILKFIIDNLTPIVSICMLCYSMIFVFTKMASNSGKIIIGELLGFLMFISILWVAYNYKTSLSELDINEIILATDRMQFEATATNADI